MTPIVTKRSIKKNRFRKNNLYVCTKKIFCKIFKQYHLVKLRIAKQVLNILCIECVLLWSLLRLSLHGLPLG